MEEEIVNTVSLFAEVILPLALPKNYTYGIPKEMEKSIAPGKRVEIQFGKKRIYAGLVKRLHHELPKDYHIKEIISVLDEEPIVSVTQLKFWQWIADYYLCSEGEVMNAALPAGFKLESETSIVLHPEFRDDFTKLNDQEYVVAEALTVHRELNMDDISKILQRKNVYQVVERLIRKNVAVVKEKLIERFKPKIETFIRLNPEYSRDEKLRVLFDELEKRAKKQLDLLMAYIHFCNSKGGGYLEIAKSELLEKSQAGNAALQSLLKKNILLQQQKKIFRVNDNDVIAEAFDLSPSQADALSQIKNHFTEKNVVLLHGVTGSGKTNLYVRLAEEVIEAGRQVLYLLPEIALTAQIIERLRKYFGNKIGIYHSRFNQQERVEIWNKLLHREYKIIVGARSALFLPFENLGLVIVDEEHDVSYKQNDPAPRYQGRDAAIFLASLFEAKTVLGSATPSMESYYNASKEKFGLAFLAERFTGIEMPEIAVADVREAKKKKMMHSHFTSILLNDLKATIEKKEQAILFQNRRGYAPYMECETCGWVAMCPNCDVHLTYHRFNNELRCHYCNHRKNSLSQCPACGSSSLHISGFGTEKIEDELKIFLPATPVARLDLDAVRAKNSYQKIINDFERGKTQVLVGTQMVTKGLDFENVSMVGVMNADQLFNYADFRSSERGFQLMSQVSGRAGRKNKRGKVVIQTSNIANGLLPFIIQHDYKGFFDEEIRHRKKFFYPPFSRLIQLTLKHKDKRRVWEASDLIAIALRKELGNRLLGPAEPPISRVKNQYLIQILIKLERSGEIIQNAKQHIREELRKLEEQPAFRSVTVITDVDP